MKLRRSDIIAAFILLVMACFFFHAFGHDIVRGVFECIYTPSALDQNKVAVYTRFVYIIQRHPEIKLAYLTMSGYLKVDPEQLDSLSAIEDELSNIPSELGRVGCLFTIKDGSYVAFIIKRNYILPRCPGVLYSLDGRNPNEVDDEFLNTYKPFKQIKGRWYMSRRLVASTYRSIDAESPLPKSSLIDHSLRYPDSLSGENIE